jgi:hypothetical protein
VTYSTCGHRYHSHCYYPLGGTCAICRGALGEPITIEVPVTEATARAELVHNRVLDEATMDMGNLLRRPSGREVILMGVVEGVLAGLLAQGLEGTYPGIGEDVRAAEAGEPEGRPPEEGAL